MWLMGSGIGFGLGLVLLVESCIGKNLAVGEIWHNSGSVDVLKTEVHVVKCTGGRLVIEC